MGGHGDRKSGRRKVTETGGHGNGRSRRRRSRRPEVTETGGHRHSSRQGVGPLGSSGVRGRAGSVLRQATPVPENRLVLLLRTGAPRHTDRPQAAQQPPGDAGARSPSQRRCWGWRPRESRPRPGSSPGPRPPRTPSGSPTPPLEPELPVRAMAGGHFPPLPAPPGGALTVSAAIGDVGGGGLDPGHDLRQVREARAGEGQHLWVTWVRA